MKKSVLVIGLLLAVLGSAVAGAIYLSNPSYTPHEWEEQWGKTYESDYMGLIPSKDEDGIIFYWEIHPSFRAYLDQELQIPLSDYFDVDPEIDQFARCASGVTYHISTTSNEEEIIPMVFESYYLGLVQLWDGCELDQSFSFLVSPDGKDLLISSTDLSVLDDGTPDLNQFMTVDEWIDKHPNY